MDLKTGIPTSVKKIPQSCYLRKQTDQERDVRAGPSSGPNINHNTKTERHKTMKTKLTTFASLIALTASAAAQSAASGGTSLMADFNGDGFADLAIGSPLEDFESGNTRVTDSGSVTIIYGSASGLATTPGTVWTQNTAGITDTCEAGDKFGAALAAGDFNRDGFTDIAVGVPGEKNASGVITGAVHILSGSSTGLRATGNSLIFGSQYSSRFGSQAGDDVFSMTCADFNGDGFIDLAVECEYGQRPLSTPRVMIFRGSSGGLQTIGQQTITQPLDAIQVLSPMGTCFDLVLDAGDFNRDGRADLVIGAPFGTALGTAAAGNVRIHFGTASGVSPTAGQILTQTPDNLTLVNGGGVVNPVVSDWSEAGDRFGAALAVGDFNGDGNPDLAVGVPLEDLTHTGDGHNPNMIRDAGTVDLFFGDGKKLSAGRQQLFDEVVWYLEGSVSPYDPWFHSKTGSALAAGDFNKDGFTDLAVGMPGHQIGNLANAGMVLVFHGSSDGLNRSRPQLWTEESAVAGAVNGAGNRFGSSLMAANFGRNYTSWRSLIAGDIKVDDLAIGIPGKTVNGVANAGAVRILHGFPNHGLGISLRLYSSSPLASQPGPSLLLRQGAGGVPDTVESTDAFGTSLR